MNGYSAAQAALIFADTPSGRLAFESAANAAGLRIVAQGGLDEAIRRLDQQMGPALILLDIDDPAHPLVMPLLNRVQADAEAGHANAIVSMALPLLDTAFSILDHPGIALLCRPDPAERLAALMFALLRPAHRLYDDGEAAPAIALLRLSEQASQIANSLVALSSKGWVDPHHPEPETGEVPPKPIDSAYIRAILRARRLRERYFDPAILADPAWDMMLDLMAARLEGQPVSVSSLCIAAAVPTTTALRWIRQLTENGLFERVPDPADGRRFFIIMSESAAASMQACLAHMAE